MRLALFTVSSFVFAILACQSRKHNDSQGEVKESIEISFDPPKSVTWTNPKYEPCPWAGRDNAHAHMKFVPQGLTLLDGTEKTVTEYQGKKIHPVELPNPTARLDTTKPIAIFIPGYDKSGGAYGFPYIEKWKDKFNTFVFRWHCETFNQGFIAEDVFSSTDNGTKMLLADYARLSEKLTRHYKQEIRLIGYSMGGPLAIDFATAAWSSSLGSTLLGDEKFRNKAEYERRIDLLDPGFFFQMLSPESIIDELGVWRYESEYNKLVKNIYNLQNMGVAITSFASSFSKIITNSMYKYINVQRVHDDWTIELIKKELEGMSEEERAGLGIFDRQHTGLPHYYFPSIDPAESGKALGSSKFPNGLSAATKTSLLRGEKIYLKQTSEGINTRSMRDDVYEVINEPCPKGHTLNFDRVSGPHYPSAQWSAIRKCM